MNQEDSIITCPVCHDTSPISSIFQFPCSHNICGTCLEQLPEADGSNLQDHRAPCVRCPVCRQACARGAAQQHPGLLMLSAAHHCSGCRGRWNGEDRMPMVLRPCLHQVCRACAAGAGDSCPVCHAGTVGAPLEDAAFWAALSTGRLALPPWEVLQDPHQQRSSAAYRLKGDLDLCVDAICALCAWLLRHPDTRRDFHWRESHLRPRAGWSADKKELFNQVCRLSIDIGKHLPLPARTGGLTTISIRDALGFTGDLVDLIFQEMDRTVRTRMARLLLPPRAQRAAHALDFLPEVTLL